MSDFFYKSRDIDGNLVEGVMDAQDEDTLATALKDRELYLTQAKKVKKKKASNWSSIQRRDLIVFTAHLGSILSAGIPIIQGLEDLEHQTEVRKFRRIIKTIREDIYGGSNLSDALLQFPNIFSISYVNMVKAGEASGQLDTILHELASFLEWQEDINSEVKKASTYPIIFLIATSFLLVAIFSFAFPRITQMLIALKVELPLITRVMIRVSGFLTDYWWMVFSGLVIIIGGYQLVGRNPKGRFYIDNIKLHIPLIGGLLRKHAVSQFSRHLALMWKAGVDTSTSLKLTAGVIGNAVVAKVIVRARDDVLSGKMISESLKGSKQIPPIVIRLISIGETAGNMGECLDKVTQYYNREVPASVKRLFLVIEPLIFIFLAFIVLSIALSIYLPLYAGLGKLGPQ